MSSVVIGLERLLDAPSRLAGRRVGILCNPVSVDRRLRHVVDLLAATPGARLERLFGPEHGVRGSAQDMIAVGDARDAATGLPVISLYGDRLESLSPRREHIDGLDVLVCDLQDVGSRYYTYAWTVVLCAEVCAAAGVEVIVCDRPNPIGGLQVEGGRILPGFESFVGLHDVPNRHGLTLGELVTLATAERGVADAVTVVPMAGWRREMSFEETGLPWVLPSPNMPTVDTAFVYPGMCLVEATVLSEGRGTTRPFELVGAPGVSPAGLAQALEARSLPGVRFRPTWFRPGFQKHAGRDCGGVQLHVTDRRAFRPYLTAVELLVAVRRLAPDAFGWRDQPYEFVRDIPAVDLLHGSPALRALVESGGDPRELQGEWVEAEATFRDRRAPHLIY